MNRLRPGLLVALVACQAAPTTDPDSGQPILAITRSGAAVDVNDAIGGAHAGVELTCEL